MLNICRFSLKYTFKKKSTSVFLGVSTIFLTLVFYLLMNSDGNDSVKIDPLLKLMKGQGSFAPFLLIALLLTAYMSIKISNIFKDGENDGTTLLLVSKQYTRLNIISGRFLAVFIHIVVFALVVLFAFFVPTLLISTNGISGVDATLLASLFVGSIFVGIILSSISLMFVVIIGKVGTLVLSMMIGTTLPILSIVLQQVSDVGVATNYYNTNQTKLLSIDSNGKQREEYAFGGVSANDQDEFKKNVINNSYNTLSYVDMWSQMSSVFSIFYPTKSSYRHAIVERSAQQISDLKERLLPINRQSTFESNTDSSKKGDVALQHYYGFKPASIIGEPYGGYSHEYFTNNSSDSWINSDSDKFENLLNKINTVYYSSSQETREYDSSDTPTDSKLYKLNNTTSDSSLYINPTKLMQLFNHLKENNALPAVDSTKTYTLFKVREVYTLFDDSEMSGTKWYQDLIADEPNMTMEKFAPKINDLVNGNLNFPTTWYNYEGSGFSSSIGGIVQQGLFQIFNQDNKSITIKEQNFVNLKKWAAYKGLLKTSKNENSLVGKYFGTDSGEDLTLHSKTSNSDNPLIGVATELTSDAAYVAEINRYLVSLGEESLGSNIYINPSRIYNPQEYLSSEDYVSQTGSIIFWSMFAIILFSGTFMIHKYRDFK